MNNRLQFRHHTPIFDTREEAIEYVYSQIRFAEEGLAYDDKTYGFSLLAEPTIIRYKNEEDETDPHVILAIGSDTNDGAIGYGDNRFCIIDIDKTESEIDELAEEIEKAIASLSIITKDTNTLKLYSEKTDNGTIISGDVVVASSHVFDDARRPNIILNTEDGLFTYVNMEFDKDNDKITFTVNDDTREWFVNNNYLVRGYYSKRDESLHLIRRDDVDITIPLENLIDEWTVEGEATNTPIVLTREEIGYGDNALHNHVEPWQDLLKADVRLADRRFNILKKSNDGRYLYVDGLANNITYFKDGQEISVQEALNDVTKGVSNDSTNIIYEKADGYFATAMLKYFNSENKLVFTTSNVTGGTSVEEIHLNAVKAFEKIYYDSVTENLIILYLDGTGAIQEVDIPIGEMMRDWEWDIVNDGHNVKLHKERVIAGNDKVSADVAIYDDTDNILVDKNHELFVKGTADNIRYGRGGNVSDELDKLNAVDVEYGDKISAIEETIGSGFTADAHETITYKFNDLSSKTDTISAKTETNTENIALVSASTEAETARAISEEQRIEQKFDDELGEGFDIRNTVRDEFNKEKAERIAEDERLQQEIDDLSESVDGKLVDIFNYDHSIDVDKTDRVRPVIKVNLSTEVEDGKPNIIKLNADGLYAGVDLDYSFNEEVGTNQLIFKTTNETKVFDLKTNSVVDKIYYDPTREAIIIEYTVNGHRMPDVVIPVHDLINEWRVSEDTSGAIKLYKFRESGATQDVLYAETIVSAHEDNILVNDSGALYVSGAQIEVNKANIESLSGRVEVIENSIGGIEGDLEAEIARATREEQRIEGLLNTEIERSEGEDRAIWAALNAEITRSTNKDIEHDANIAAEVIRATSAETEIRNNVSNIENALQTEITRSTNKDNEHDAKLLALRTDLEQEIDRATTTEHSIHDEVVAESVVRQSGDTSLNAKIETEITRATNKETSIENALQAEITRSTNKDNEHDASIATLISDLNAEVQRATNAERDLQTDITTEVTRATNAETALNTEIENVEDALQAEITRSTNKDIEHDTRINELRSDLNNEVTARSNSDNRLENLISAEENRAKLAESAITHDLQLETVARQNADATLDQKIETETDRATLAESQLQTSITSESTSRVNEDNRIEALLQSEITRSTNRDDSLQQQITTESTTARAAESSLREGLTQEISDRTVSYANLQTQITNEKERAQGAEAVLSNRLDAEKDARETEDEHIWAKIRPIEFYDTTTIHNDRVRNSGENPDEVRHSVILSQADKNILAASDTLGGLYATARLGYNQSANALTIYGPDDRIINTVTLGPGSLIKDISYDQVEKDLVITYRRAGDDEDTIMKFPVADLFNEWDIQNPSEGSALELHKINQTGETGTVDILWGRVLLTGAVERPDGTIDYGDNIIRIVNNGLYASGSAITEAKDTALCTRSELRVVETAVLGTDLSERYICGSGFTYTPYEQACFINAATSMYDADKILDNYVCSAHTRITKVEEDVDCLWQEVNVTQENVLGITIPDCGIKGDGTPFKYVPHIDACIINNARNMDDADLLLDQAICEISGGFSCISAETKMVENVLGIVGNCENVISYPATQGCLLSTATSFAEADAIMETAICSLQGLVTGSETPTVSMNVEDDGTSKHLEASVRLSHGNDQGKWQSDEDLTITDYQGDVIESAETYVITEFTDTNVLRVVNLTDTFDVKPESRYNGLYLSNVWDCGQYTENGEGTPYEKYKIDDSPTSMNYYTRKYRNGVRYEIPTDNNG